MDIIYHFLGDNIVNTAWYKYDLRKLRLIFPTIASLCAETSLNIFKGLSYLMVLAV